MRKDEKRECERVRERGTSGTDVDWEETEIRKERIKSTLIKR